MFFDTLDALLYRLVHLREDSHSLFFGANLIDWQNLGIVVGEIFGERA